MTVGAPVAATAVSVISRHTWLSEHPFDAAMSAFQSPLVRYGIALPSAAVAVAIGLLVFDGIPRYLAFGIAAIDLLVLPWILKNAN